MMERLRGPARARIRTGGVMIGLAMLLEAWLGCPACGQAALPKEKVGTSKEKIVQPKEKSDSSRRPFSRAAGNELLAVIEEEPWMAAAAAPVAARLQQQSGRPALLVALSNPPTHESDWLVALAAPRRATILTPGGRPKLGANLEKLFPDIFPVSASPSEATTLIARRFWKQSPEAVVAPADDPEGVILGAALAAGQAIPLLIRERTDSRVVLAQALEDLGVQRIVVAVGDPDQAPAWARSRKYQSDVCGPAELQHRLIVLLGAGNVRNIIVARSPERQGAGKTAWLAPYMSLGRGAPVVLSRSISPAVAEVDVARLVEREGLRPRTITVLADHASIGQHQVEIEIEESASPAASGTAGQAALGQAPATPPAKPAPKSYFVRTEPCVERDFQKTVLFGVGRIPFESLGDASVLFARGLVRERLLADRAPRLLMVANAGMIHKPLPLGETISRETAEEFKNFGIRVDGFFGKLADSPEILTAAKSATMIIYEGHASYQDMIDFPTARRTRSPDPYFEEELEDLSGGQQVVTPPDAALSQPGDEPPAAMATDPMRTVDAQPEVNRLQGPLSGLPIVILQACGSLEEPLFWRVDEMGGVAVIGSVTAIHSGSGSAMIHAATSAALYRGGTVGEAFRDAQNYMFSVEELRSRRGHKELAKGRRVALSFRLWGDPELRVFPGPCGQPRSAPVAGRWTAPAQLTIDMPPARLPEVRSSKYVADMFPGSQAAGMVKPAGLGDMRRLVPIYFFHLPLPEELDPNEAAGLEFRGSTAHRATFRVDLRERCCYVVYYPEQEKAGESVVLRLAPARQGGRNGRTVP